jgi:hypothetical protein
MKNSRDMEQGAPSCSVVSRLIGVPQIVMDGLEVPDDLAGRRLQRHDRVGVRVVPRPQTTVVVRTRRYRQALRGEHVAAAAASM